MTRNADRTRFQSFRRSVPVARTSAVRQGGIDYSRNRPREGSVLDCSRSSQICPPTASFVRICVVCLATAVEAMVGSVSSSPLLSNPHCCCRYCCSSHGHQRGPWVIGCLPSSLRRLHSFGPLAAHLESRRRGKRSQVGEDPSLGWIVLILRPNKRPYCIRRPLTGSTGRHFQKRPSVTEPHA